MNPITPTALVDLFSVRYDLSQTMLNLLPITARYALRLQFWLSRHTNRLSQVLSNFRVDHVNFADGRVVLNGVDDLG